MNTRHQPPPGNHKEISLSLVTALIAQQFPQWAHLPIKPIALSGWDNRTFHLGDEMLIRLPSAESYALQVAKEQKWLPILAPHLSCSIPEPLALGQPSTHYPWNWSIYRWLEGTSANMLSLDDEAFAAIAAQLAQFLNELQQIDATSGPLAGAHNYYRGAHPAVYDEETRTAITQLSDLIDGDMALAVWQKALNSTWQKNPVWLHGDVSSGNILINHNRLVAVIDFGCMGVGDPACDLVIAWTFFKNNSRKIFQSNLTIDSDTWARARGWALWKAVITLAPLEDKHCPQAIAQQQIIQALLAQEENS